MAFLPEIWSNVYVAAIGVLAMLGGGLCSVLLIANRYLANYGTCTIQVNDEEPVPVRGGGTLLESLYEQRIFIPSACGGQGTCGFCRVQVLEGAGPVLPTELPYLSEADLAAGTRLACQVKIRRDIRLRISEHYLRVQEYRAAVSACFLVTPDTREIHLSLRHPECISFQAGQYVQVVVPGRREITFRAYSIASPPSRTDHIDLLVRLIPGGAGSTYLHGVQPGDEVRFTGPYGDFELDASPETALVCIGGGCGMAPMRSLLRHVAELAPTKPCSLYFGARTPEHAMYRDAFRELASQLPQLDIHYALSAAGTPVSWDGETGMIHESVARFLQVPERLQVFLCGPPQMIEAALAVLAAKGVPRERIFFDEF